METTCEESSEGVCDLWGQNGKPHIPQEVGLSVVVAGSQLSPWPKKPKNLWSDTLVLQEINSGGDRLRGPDCLWYSGVFTCQRIGSESSTILSQSRKYWNSHEVPSIPQVLPTSTALLLWEVLVLGVQVPSGWKGSGIIPPWCLGKHRGMQLLQKMPLCPGASRVTSLPGCAWVPGCHWGHWHCHSPSQGLVMSFSISMPKSSQ